jgi:signal transduction histidine kinase
MWDENDQRRIYVEGLTIRAVSAGAFAVMFAVGILWDWHRLIPGYWAVQIILVSLIAMNPVLWVIGQMRSFPMHDLYVHWLVDVLAVASIVYLLGVFQIPLSPIAFMIMIVSSAAYMTKGAAFYLAGLSSVAWIALWSNAGRMGDERTDVLGIHISESGEWFLGVATIVFFFVFAYVAGMVADKLRQKTRAVVEQRRETENGLWREKMARREIETLSAIVQHDVYGPLSAIKGVALELEEELALGRVEGSTELLKLVHRQVASIEAAVESLGLFDVEDEGGSICLADIVSRVLSDLDALISERSVSVQVEDTQLRVSVNRRRCYHVLRNLVSNAVKCVPEDGGGMVRIYAEEDGQSRRLIIEDNGPGLSERFIEALTRNEPVTPERSRSGEGLGIGLFLTRRLVQSWGGRVEYVARPGGGAAIGVTFPERPRSRE